MVICSSVAMSSLPDNISWSDTVSVGGGSTGGEESDRPMLPAAHPPPPPTWWWRPLTKIQAGKHWPGTRLLIWLRYCWHLQCGPVQWTDLCLYFSSACSPCSVATRQQATVKPVSSLQVSRTLHPQPRPDLPPSWGLTFCVLTERNRMLSLIKNKHEISLPVAGNLYFISHKISLTAFGCCFTVFQCFSGL